MNSLLQIIIGVSLIAFAPILGRVGSTIIDPVLFSFYDVLTAFTAITIILVIKKPKVVKGVSRDLILSSLTYSFAVLFYFTALSLTSSVNVAFLSQFQLIPTIILAFLFLKEKPTHYKLLGGLIVFIGGLLIIYQDSVSFSFGWIYALIAFLFFSFVNVFMKSLRDKEVDAKIILFFNTGLASAFFLAYITITGIPLVFNYGFLFAFINGLLADSLGFFIFINALKRVELSKAFMLFSVGTFFTFIYSQFIFGLNLIIIQLLGGALLIGGNVLANKSEKVV